MCTVQFGCTYKVKNSKKSPNCKFFIFTNKKANSHFTTCDKKLRSYIYVKMKINMQFLIYVHTPKNQLGKEVRGNNILLYMAIFFSDLQFDKTLIFID